MPECKFGKVVHVVDEKACCKEYKCECPPKELCTPENITDHNLEVGQCLVRNDDYCCPKHEKKCCKDQCPEPPVCHGEFEKPQLVRNGTCCPEYSCQCFPSLCPIITPPTCRHDENLIIKNVSVCCKDYECECPATCENRTKPNNLRPGQVAVNKKALGWCCDDWIVECKKENGTNLCPENPTCEMPGMVNEVIDDGPCCSISKCTCKPSECPDVPLPECDFDKVVIRSNADEECCAEYKCKCPKNCTHEPKPSDDLLEVGQVWVKDERYCCDKWIKHCIGSCPAKPVCDEYEMQDVIQNGTCCDKTICGCVPTLCKKTEMPTCGKFHRVVVVDPNACCKTFKCECIPKNTCPNVTKPTDLEVGETIVIDDSGCCEEVMKKCSGNCPPEQVCPRGQKPVVTHQGKCCNETSCQCFPELCPPETNQPPQCPFDKIVRVKDAQACCKEYECICPPEEMCEDEPEPSNLEMGQIAVKDDRYCCQKWNVICGGTCPPKPDNCKLGERVEVVRNGTCCKEYACGCYVSECPKIEIPVCRRKDEKLEVVDETACCKTYHCVCPPTEKCPIIKPPVPVYPGEVVVPNTDYCCDRKHLECHKDLCPTYNKTCGQNQIITELQIPEDVLKCCPLHECTCKPKSSCEITKADCKFDKVPTNVPADPFECCEKEICKCPDCEGRHEPKPEGLQPGQVAIKDENFCCDKYIVKCHKDLCKPDPDCEEYEQLVTVSEPGLCCPIKICQCKPSKCTAEKVPTCKEDQMVKVIDPLACCKKYQCECIAPENCTQTEAPTDLDEGQFPIVDSTGCCPKWRKICRSDKCPPPPVCKEHEVAKIIKNGTCCPIYICECFKKLCKEVETPKCDSIVGQYPVIKDPKACCTEFKCVCPPKCPPINKIDESTLEKGQIIETVTEGRCCPQRQVTCGKCPPDPTCRRDEKLEVVHVGACCNTSKCVCKVCPPPEIPKCAKLDMITKVIDPNACCKKFQCICPKPQNCTDKEKPTDLEIGEVAVLDERFCCKEYKKECLGKCPADPKCDQPGMTLQTVNKGKCCETKKCGCVKTLCPVEPEPICKYDKQVVDVNPGDCCVKKTCQCPKNCSELDNPQPTDLQEGQVAVRDERFCCDRWKIVCGGKCKKDPSCKSYETLTVKNEGPCCNDTECVCAPEKCQQKPEPTCRNDQRLTVINPNACCKEYKCKCITPKQNCTKPEIPDDLKPGQVVKIDESKCCPKAVVECDVDKCPKAPLCKGYERLDSRPGVCCNISKCVCDECKVPEQPTCKLPDQKVKAIKLNKCCNGLTCYCDKCSKDCATGYKYFEPEVDKDGNKLTCCGQCKPVVCFENDKSKVVPTIRQPGEKWNKPKDPCTVFECLLQEDGTAEIATMVIDCKQHCKLGEKYVVKEGQCCGTCVKTQCVFENVTIDVGESIVHDSCCNFTCIKDEDTGLPVDREACVTCTDECDPGFEFEPPNHKECCGNCVQTKCIVDGKELEVGQSIPAPNATCFNLVCETSKTEDGKTAFTVKKYPKYGICPPTPCEEECLEPDARTEGCCQQCKPHCHPTNKTCSPKSIFATPEQSKDFIKIIRNGKVCVNKKVIPDLKECAGLCPSLTYIEGTNDKKHMGKCSCCSPETTKPRQIMLTCSDQKVIPYTYHEPSSCKCNQSSCEKKVVTDNQEKRSEDRIIDAMKDLLDNM